MMRLVQIGATCCVASLLSIVGCDRENADPATAAREAREEVREEAREVREEVREARAVPTAEDQSMAASDEEITRIIREGVTASEALSIEARACTIITRANVVTLRGGVANEGERETIAAIARRTSGVSRVENLLELH